MVKLPTVTDNVVLTQAPRSGLSAADIANPYRIIGEALGNAGTVLQQRDVREAQAEGQNAVYRDADGTLKVRESPYGSLGARADAYERAALQGYAARLSGDVRTTGAQLAAEAKGDVAAFETSWRGFRTQLLKSVPEDVRGSFETLLESEGKRLSLGVSEAKRTRDIKIFEGDIKAEIQALDDEMAALARGGGTGSTAYQERRAQVASLYGELAANPDFAVGEKEVEVSLKRMESRHAGEAVVGSIDATLAAEGALAAKKEAERLLTDETLALTPAERRQYHTLAEARITSWRSEQKLALEPWQARAKEIKGLLTEGVGIDNPEIDTVARALARGGDAAGALELYQAQRAATTLAGFRQMDDEAQTAALERGVAAADGSLSRARATRAAGMTRSMGGDLRKTISDAAARHGVDPHALQVIAWLESRGNPDARNPNSSAGGLFQFIDTTAATYGLANRFDPAEASDAAARLMKDNAAALRTALGREPTVGELYLAHQQGAGGAIKLLANPTALAVDVVGAEAVRLNGGSASMTAAEFASLWTRKAGDAAPAFVDPDLIKEYRSEVTGDAKDLWEDMKAGLTKGVPPAPEEVDLLSRQLALIDDADFREEVSRFFNAEAGAAMMAELPHDQAAAIVSALKADAADGATIAQQDLLAAAERGAAQKAAALKADPVGYAADHGIVPPLPAIDLAAGPEAVGGALAARQKAVDMLRLRGDVGIVSALRPEDQATLGRFLQTATPGEQAQLLGSMAGALKPDTYLATMAGLADKVDTKALAAAGALYPDNPAVAEGILRGRQLLRENGKLAPKATDDTRAAIDGILPPAAFGPMLEGARQSLLEAATARYADLSHAAGDTSGDLVETRMEQAINEVTGGLLDFNGAEIIAPRYGMTQDEFDDRMAALSIVDLDGAVTADGTAITPRDVLRHGRLRSVGDGAYVLQFGPEDAPSYAMAADGGPFVLRLSVH